MHVSYTFISCIISYNLSFTVLYFYLHSYTFHIRYFCMLSSDTFHVLYFPMFSIYYTFHIPFSFIYFLYFTCSYPFRVLYFVLSIYCIHVLFMYYFHIPIFMYCSFHIWSSCTLLLVLVTVYTFSSAMLLISCHIIYFALRFHYDYRIGIHDRFDKEISSCLSFSSNVITHLIV